MKFAYLADIFNLLNQLNLSLQGRDANILLSQNKITAFIKKLNIWNARIKDNVVDMFPVLCDYIANKPLIQGCQTQIHSGPKLRNEVKSRVKLKVD